MSIAATAAKKVNAAENVDDVSDRIEKDRSAHDRCKAGSLQGNQKVFHVGFSLAQFEMLAVDLNPLGAHFLGAVAPWVAIAP